MPKVNLGKNPTDEDIKAKISEYRTRRGVSVADLCTRADISTSAYHNYIKNPSRFRIRDLRRIYDVLKVPIDERKGV